MGLTLPTDRIPKDFFLSKVTYEESKNAIRKDAPPCSFLNCGGSIRFIFSLFELKITIKKSLKIIYLRQIAKDFSQFAFI